MDSEGNSGKARERNSLRETLALGFLQIRARDAVILKRWLGWDGPAETLEEIGLDLQVSRERIRQLRNRARDELRDWVEWELTTNSKLERLLSTS